MSESTYLYGMVNGLVVSVTSYGLVLNGLVWYPLRLMVWCGLVCWCPLHYMVWCRLVWWYGLVWICLVGSIMVYGLGQPGLMQSCYGLFQSSLRW